MAALPWMSRSQLSRPVLLLRRNCIRRRWSDDNSTPTRLQEEHNSLSAKIYHHRRLYEKGRPEISDAEYDGLFQRLQALEHKHPSLLSHHSPSVQINVPFVDQDKRLLVNHLVPMLGLKNAYDNDDLARFWKSTQKKTHSDVMELEEHEKHNGKNDLQIAGGMVCEMKYDGIAVALRYRNGRFVSAATRGDGQRGHSITQHCESVDDIPKQLEAAPKEVEIRGELVITREHYGAMRKLTRTSSDNGGEAEISSRNFIAGLLHRKQASPEVLRSLSFVAYEAMASGRTGEDWHLSHNERMQLLSQSGFRTCQRRTLVHSFQDALTFIARQEDTTASLLFYCDGIVLKVNDIRLREALGSTQRHPRWAIAYKFEGGTAITRVVGVEASVGRSGKVTPVALLEPVSIGGATLSRVTLNNKEYVDRLNVHIGDLVQIERSGGVIPKVLSVVDQTGSDTDRRNALLSHCPCQHRAELVVENDSMGIKGLGKKRVEALMDAGVVSDVIDLFGLHRKRDVLLALAGWGEASVDHLLAHIHQARTHASPTTVLRSLALPGIGGKTAQEVGNACSNLHDLLSVTQECLVASGISNAVAVKAISSLREETNMKIIRSVIEAIECGR